MSTRALIGLLESDNQLRCISINRDGYPDYVGELLVNKYNNVDIIKKLLLLGNLGDLNKSLAGCRAYNEPAILLNCTKETAVDTLLKEAGRQILDYAYLFDNNKWRCWDAYGKIKEIPLYKKSSESDEESEKEELIEDIKSDLEYIISIAEEIKEMAVNPKHQYTSYESLALNICAAAGNIRAHLNLL